LLLDLLQPVPSTTFQVPPTNRSPQPRGRLPQTRRVRGGVPPGHRTTADGHTPTLNRQRSSPAMRTPSAPMKHISWMMHCD